MCMMSNYGPAELTENLREVGDRCHHELVETAIAAWEEINDRICSDTIAQGIEDHFCFVKRSIDVAVRNVSIDVIGDPDNNFMTESIL